MFESATNELNTGVDPFIGVSPPPTTFRIGSCKSRENEADFEVLFLWKTDVRSEQKQRDVTLQKVGDQWLVHHIASMP